MTDRLLTGCRLATMDPARPGLGLVEDGVLAIRGGTIAYVGARADLPSAFRTLPTESMGGRVVTPGLIDAHTHLVYAGDRSDEFERRLAGESYADIARSGGGIASTVRATAAASPEALVAAALPRLDALIAEGVTTVEVKSGYGLSTAAELKQLDAARALASHRLIGIEPTFLALHAAPKDEPRAAFLDRIIDEVLPRVARERLATAVDAFQEGIAFTAEEVDRLFRKAAGLGLPVKLHADQLSDTGGAALAARHGALSADHLEYASDAGVRAMARSGTVAMILPGAFLMLGETQKPPIAAFRAAGVPMAVATDLNPGSSPIASLRLSATLACVMFGLTVEEVWLGMTRHAARALGRDDIGVLRPGARADIAVWSVDGPAEVVAKVGPSPLHLRLHGGS